MKTIKSIRFILFFLGLVSMSLTTLQATEINYYLGKTTVNLSTEAGKQSLVLRLENTGSEKMLVTISDQDGNVLKSETVESAPSFTKRYDFSRLPEGDYTFSVSKTLMEKVQPFTITKKEVVVDESKAIDKFSPMIRTTANHLDVNLLLSGAADVKVIISNAAGDKVFGEKVASDRVFNRRYNLAALTAGEYTFEIKTEGKVFYKTFEVE